ncbi:hypothetical protein OG21DRAFT_1513798 [Imleria badia]|nr:hypothetical protein OG21DRAFT_1513798 [Imleria badia]
MSDREFVTSVEAPALIGLAISGCLYGVFLGQLAHYVVCFPKDPRPVKLLVFFVLIADTLHLIGTTEFFYTMLVPCRRNDSAACQIYVSWGVYFTVSMTYLVTFAVQSFYCHRIWIITGKNRVITIPISLLTVLQLTLGAWTTIDVIRHGTIQFLDTTSVRSMRC